MREAKALRGLSYYNVIDLWGRGVVAWDNDGFGRRPPQAESRAALYDKVVEDLEQTLECWPEANNGAGVVYGRIGKDALEALLCRTSIPRCGQAFRAMTNAGNMRRT